jgi:hypothetical protein
VKLIAFILSVLIAAAFLVASRLTPRADCKDGTVSYSKQRSGTCSRHGGVLKWR